MTYWQNYYFTQETLLTTNACKLISLACFLYFSLEIRVTHKLFTLIAIQNVITMIFTCSLVTKGQSKQLKQILRRWCSKLILYYIVGKRSQIEPL